MIFIPENVAIFLGGIFVIAFGFYKLFSDVIDKILKKEPKKPPLKQRIGGAFLAVLGIVVMIFIYSYK